MNPAHITDLITAIKEDKSIAQPWRNYTLKALFQAVAYMEKGQRTTNLQPPADLHTQPFQKTSSEPQTGACSCPEGAVDKTCPVHNESSSQQL